LFLLGAQDQAPELDSLRAQLDPCSGAEVRVDALETVLTNHPPHIDEATALEDARQDQLGVALPIDGIEVDVPEKPLHPARRTHPREASTGSRRRGARAARVTPGDRPDVIPKGARNFAFLGQFAETGRDCIFTTEYSVRTGTEATYALLGVERG
jgi:hypothetical protein